MTPGEQSCGSPPAAKDPEGDAAAPAAMPDSGKGGSPGRPRDPAGQQGGTRGGGKDQP